MQVAASLVPLQICRCEGNILCPMSDGKLLDVGGSADAEETLDIDNVARSINFGMYDAILEVIAGHGRFTNGQSSGENPAALAILMCTVLPFP